MSICVLCNRNFGSDKALKQHEVNSPKHASFGSDRTLKQDRVNSPEPALFGCKACNRSFSSQAALSQHQKDSAVHQRPRKDSGTTAVTPALLADNFPLPVPTSPNGRSTSQNDQSSRETTTENISRAYLTFDSPFTVLENRLRALNITDVNAIVAAQKIDQAHRPTRQQETKISFKFPELHQRIAEAVAPEIAFTWFNYDMEAHPEHSYTTSVMGKFTCVNKKCRKSGWSSKVVATGIRGYPRSGYNAIVYNQHCDSCERLGSFKLNKESYVERIAYRLKKWAGVPVEKPPFMENSNGPHESDFCEGCKVNECPWMDK